MMIVGSTWGFGKVGSSTFTGPIISATKNIKLGVEQRATTSLKPAIIDVQDWKKEDYTIGSRSSVDIWSFAEGEKLRAKLRDAQNSIGAKMTPIAITPSKSSPDYMELVPTEAEIKLLADIRLGKKEVKEDFYQTEQTPPVQPQTAAPQMEQEQGECSLCGEKEKQGASNKVKKQSQLPMLLALAALAGFVFYATKKERNG